MECLVGFAPTAAAAAIMRPPLSYATKKNRNGELRAKLNDGDDPLLQTAITNASLRFQETHRPVPLFVDPYAGCFFPPNIQMNMTLQPHPYCLANKFIDDKLLSIMNRTDGLNQVVLLADGMETRPYRLKWPTSTLIFDVSPDRVFRIAAKKLEDVGGKIQRSCLLLHVPVESSDLGQNLRVKGFNGNRPSIWVFQGLPVMNLASFEEILFFVSSLAMKGCHLMGELPGWLAETEVKIKSCNKVRWMDKLFLRHGFRVEVIDYDNIAGNLYEDAGLGNYNNILFVAEHLRFSDDEMESWRSEFQRIEDEGDEEGFEEL